jgi:hypothetical protein
MSTDGDENKSTKKTKLTKAIYALQTNLPHLELSLSEIGELKQKVLKKERELEEAIAENKAVLEEIYARSQDDFNELLHGDESDDTDPLEPEDEDEATDKRMGRERNDLETEIETETKIYYQGETESAIALLMRAGVMDEAMVADMILKSSNDDLIKRQAATEEALRVHRIAQDCLRGEIAEDERVLEELQREVEERRQMFRDCEAEKVALSEKAVALETELADLEKKFCELNEQTTGSSVEESHALLQSIRRDPQQTNTRSPILKSFAAVVREFIDSSVQMTELETRMSDPRVEDLCRQEEEAREKLSLDRERVPSLATEEEKLLRETKACEAEASVLQTTARDLIVAMRWGKWASRGLCEPNPSTAPLLLLLFEQYCRQQVPFKRLDAREMSEAPDLSRRFDCEGRVCDVGIYIATAARNFGYSAAELRTGGYSIQEIQQAGYSLREMVACGFTVVDLTALGVTIDQLKGAGCSAAELKEAACSAGQLKEAGYSAAELKRGGYSIQEIQQAGYSLREMVASGFSVDEFTSLGITIHRLRRAGFSAADPNRAGSLKLQVKKSQKRVKEAAMQRIKSWICEIIPLDSQKGLNINVEEVVQFVSTLIISMNDSSPRFSLSLSLSFSLSLISGLCANRHHHFAHLGERWTRHVGYVLRDPRGDQRRSCGIFPCQCCLFPFLPSQ